MPGKDLTRWQQNEDGTWSRKLSDHTEVGVANATASAVQLAEELGVDLANVTGTGKDGKITKPDVEEAATAQ